MPELPEVETVRRGLAPGVVGRRIATVEILDPRWCAPQEPRALEALLRGETIAALERRGKWLLWRLSSGRALVTHLRMTGTFLVDAPAPSMHTRVRVELADGTRIVFVDPRRFGTGELVQDAAALDAFLAARLGPEPLDPGFGAAALRAALAGSRAPLKAALLDQRRIAGIGNIYADEALFRARLHPLREAGGLRPAQAAALRDAIVVSLLLGIDHAGATIDDFRAVDGAYGTFQDQFLVHRREGEPCPVCGTPIAKSVVAGRGTYVCRSCQPQPRRRRVTPR